MKTLIENNSFNMMIQNLLLEAKTPDQVLDILSKKYQNESNEARNIISQIMSIDPTKKYSYTQWVVSISNTINDLSNNCSETNFQKLKQLFDFAKQNHDFQLQTFKTLKDAILGMTDFNGKYEYDIVYENQNWIIYVPNTYAASRYIVHHMYGGATWCTASSNGDYYFKNYTDSGQKLYILANKRTKEIYQYSPRTNEFHDNYNCQVDYPSTLVGRDIYNWFEDKGMDIDEGGFPGPEDIYEGGDYGLRCVNDLFYKYHLCDSHGHDIEAVERVIWSPVSIDEYEKTIVIKTNEDRKQNWYVYNTDTWECIAYFNDDIQEPFFWGRGSVFGLGDSYFQFVSLVTGEKYCEMDDVTSFEKVNYSIVLGVDGYPDGYKLYNWRTKEFYQYTDSDGVTKDVYFDSEPYFNEKTKEFEGEDEDGNEITFSDERNEYKNLSEPEEEEEYDDEDEMIQEVVKKEINNFLNENLLKK